MAISARPIGVYPITTRELEVLRVADVTPGMRRITLGGEQLREFRAENGFPVAAFRSDGFDDDFKIILRHPELDAALVPTQADGTLNWPRDPRLIMRTYTVRRWDAEAGELDVDFVKHGTGPATSWAYRAQPGERVQIAGPKLTAGQPAGADWILIAGDETALPSIGRWLEEFPADMRAQVFIEVADESHRQELTIPAGVEVTWLIREGKPAGTTTLLYDAIIAAPWWEGSAFAWIAGEAGTLAPIRSWLRKEKGLAKEYVDVTGYWRHRGETTEIAADALPETGTVEEGAQPTVYDRLEIVPAFALRVGATIGLYEALGQSKRSLPELARLTGTNEHGLGKLLRFLAAIDIVESTGDRTYRLTEEGEELDDEHFVHELTLDGDHAQRELGVLALLAAVRTGRGDYSRWFGADYRELRYANEAALIHTEDDPELIVESVAKSDLFEGVKTLVVHGTGAGSYAVALTNVRPELHVTVAGHPSELAAIRTVHGERDRITLEPFSFLQERSDEPDAVLLINLLDTLPDADAAHILDRAAVSVARGGAVYLLGSPVDHANAGEHEYENDLIDFAIGGGGCRDGAEYESIFQAAGLVTDTRSTIGWGEILFRLVRTP